MFDFRVFLGDSSEVAKLTLPLADPLVCVFFPFPVSVAFISVVSLLRFSQGLRKIGHGPFTYPFNLIVYVQITVAEDALCKNTVVGVVFLKHFDFFHELLVLPCYLVKLLLEFINGCLLKCLLLDIHCAVTALHVLTVFAIHYFVREV